MKDIEIWGLFFFKAGVNSKSKCFLGVLLFFKLIFKRIFSRVSWAIWILQFWCFWNLAVFLKTTRFHVIFSQKQLATLNISMKKNLKGEVKNLGENVHISQFRPGRCFIWCQNCPPRRFYFYPIKVKIQRYSYSVRL